jgi:hypothetical protein
VGMLIVQTQLVDQRLFHLLMQQEIAVDFDRAAR